MSYYSLRGRLALFLFTAGIAETAECLCLGFGASYLGFSARGRRIGFVFLDEPRMNTNKHLFLFFLDTVL